jgi:hypothetical protein
VGLSAHYFQSNYTFLFWLKSYMVSSRQVDGETRVGVFAACSIEVGEPLTYDYR